MATFTDLSELDGYEVPATGETIVIEIAENYYGAYELYGTNILNFTAEDGNEVGTLDTDYDNQIFSFYGLDGDGEGVIITFDVGPNTEQSIISNSIAFYDAEGEPLGDYLFYQAGGTQPVQGDIVRNLYRNGSPIKRMYRSGELIYWKVVPPSNS